MKRTGLFALFAIAAGTLLGAASGCELIASVDRTKISEGGGGAGGGGAGGAPTTTTTTTGGGGTGGSMCDPANCPAPTEDCQVAACDDMGACTFANAEDGTDATTQTDGDCKKNVCTGGMATAENDDADIFDDGNDCTVDTCSAGDPQSDPATMGAMCASDGGKVCDGMGACKECLSNTDCADPNPICSAGNTCIPATCTDGMKNGPETDVDCGGGTCDPCDTNKDCAVDTDCFHGDCGGNNKCAMPTCSDGIQNNGDYLTGANGETDTDCGGPCGATCGPMEGCNDAGDCVGAQCSGMGGSCVPNCADMVANNAETDVDCGGGTCGGCAIGDMCGAADSNCVPIAYCEGGTCAAKKALGVMCGGNNQCTSAFCVDTVCCNVACSGTCQACNIAGDVGTCSFIAGGTDPIDECTGNGGNDVCDGNGACSKANGTTCSAAGECASGFCTDGVCCEALCDGLCLACSAAQTGGMDGTCGNVAINTDPEDECVASLDCNGAGACETKLANGAACTVAGECSSNQCVDDVCCGTACGGLCQACSAAKKGSGADGTCGPIANNTDPDMECAGALSCNGASACLKADGDGCGVGTECGSGNCVDSVCCDTACDAACKACNVMGSVGICTNAAEGMQDTCMAGQTCMAGACQ